MSATPNSATTGLVFEKSRVFDAPRDRVWQAWSERDQLGQWWGPKGCSLRISRFEFRPGGFCHYEMNFAGAPATWGRFNYREIVQGERLVWLNSFANENCGIARAPFSDLCPLEIENTVTFTEQDSATTISLRAKPFGETADEREFFNELCSTGSLDQGYSGTLEMLAEHLSEQ
jgi:uncharacterized protein YndB with AHSA1/START domain